MELHFDSRKIDEIEALGNRPFVSLIASMKMSNTLLFVLKGADCKDKDEAYAKLDQYMKPVEEGGEGGDMDSLNDLIMEALQKAGFLSRKVDLKDQETLQEIAKNPQVMEMMKSLMQ